MAGRASFLALLVSLSACGGAAAMPDASGADSGADAEAPDAGALDAGHDAGPPRVDGGPMPTFDTSTTWPAMPLACAAGPAHRAGRDLGAQRLFALSVLHYNVQYVAGGLSGFTIGGRQPFPTWTDDRVQDAIVTESLVPVLNLLDAHPTWTLSIEMQGYLMEVLLARHRPVAQHLSDLVRSGQVELVSFHYADQLFLAYPRHHMERSRALNLATWAAGCIVPSGPVFTQEGQFGEGMADLLGSGGDAAVMLPKNLFGYFHPTDPVAPYYATHGVPVVIAGRDLDDAATGFQANWVYMNDAELLATDGVNPYFPPSFVASPTAVARFESELTALEASGWVIAGVSDYVATLEGAGVVPTPLPAMLDGTWQPDDTANLGRWMGDVGMFAAGERDNGVLTTCSEAGREVFAAETLLATARTAGHEPPGAAADLDRAWRDLLLGEVSDTTGWNPIPNEPYYGAVQAGLAETRARSVALAAAAALGVSPPFSVNTATGTAAPAPFLPVSTEDDPSPPFAVTPAAGRRGFTATWRRGIGDAVHHVLTVDFPATLTPASAEVALPWRLSSVRYTPALLDGTSVDVPLTGLTIPAGATIPINAGPFGLDTDVWLVLDTASVSLGARLDTAAHTVTFRDDTLKQEETTTWTFHVVTGPLSAAQALADTIDLHPTVGISAP